MSVSPLHRLRLCGLLLLLLTGLYPAGGGTVLAATDLEEQAFRAAQRLLYTRTSETIDRIAQRLAQRDPRAAALIQERDIAVNRLRALNTSYLQAAAEAPPGGSPKSLAMKNSLEQAAAELQRLERDIARQFPDYERFRGNELLTIDEAKNLLGADEAIVLFVTGPRATHVWAIDRQRHLWQRVPVTQLDVREWVDSIRASLGARGIDVAIASRAAVSPFAKEPAPAQPFDRSSAFKLYDALLAPMAPLIRDKSRLNVVVDQALASLPLSLLLTEPHTDETGTPMPLNRLSWLLERSAVAYYPSLSSLRALRQRTGVSRGRVAFIGIGAPCVPGARSQDCQAFLAQSSAFRQPDRFKGLEALPFARLELEAMRVLHGVGTENVWQGTRATERYASVNTALLSEARVLLFATHGLRRQDIVGLDEPALLMTPGAADGANDDGLLTASEVTALKLDADWVILSACNTGTLDRNADAAALSGLAEAFFFAGARSVLVSHWPVRDAAAARVTTRTAELRLKDGGRDLAEALRQAKLELIESDGAMPLAAHPRVWAPFSLMGGTQ